MRVFIETFSFMNDKNQQPTIKTLMQLTDLL